MFSYTAYGLHISSELPLPELMAADAEADVVVRLGNVEHLPAEATDLGGWLWATAQKAYLFHERVGIFLVQDGREIIVEPIPGVEKRTLRIFVLGSAMNLLLTQRGYLVLHASAVAISDWAFAFLGTWGAGKSTMAAALHAQGHKMVTDDVAAVHIGTGCPTVLPSFPQFKLWPDSVVSLAGVPETLPILHPDIEKRAYPVTNGIVQMPVALRCIYVLSDGAAPAVEPLEPQEALTELIPHWYGARFGTRLLQAVELSWLFQQCAQLTKQVPIYRLKRPQSFSLLPELVQLVEEHHARDIQ